MRSSRSSPAEPRADSVPSDRSRDAAGFTLMETMIALACFMVLIFGFWAFALRASDAMMDSSSAAGSAARAAIIDAALRKSASRIAPPFWAGPREGPEDSSDGTLAMPYLDGDPESKLSVSFEGGKLVIQDDKGSMGFKVDSVASMRLLGAEPGEDADDGMPAYGLEVAYAFGKKTFTTRASFSSASLVSAGGTE